MNFEYYVPLTSFNRSVFNKELTLLDIMKFTKDDNMKCLVVEHANGSFYGFSLVDENERHDATNIIADVGNDFTIIGWRISEKKAIMGKPVGPNSTNKLLCIILNNRL